MTFSIRLRQATSAAWACAALATLAAAGPAAAQNNVTLDNLRITMPEGKSTLTIPKVEVTDTNLSRDEIARLFSSNLDKTEANALATRMKAARISIPEAALAGKEGRIAFGPFLASGIDQGRFEKASLAAFGGSYTDENGEEGSVKSGALELEGGNLASVLAAARAGDMAGATVQLGRISWSGFEMTFADKDTAKTVPGGNRYTIKLGSLEARTSYEGVVPLKSAGELKGFVIEPPKGSGFGKSLADFGLQRLDLGLAIAATYDPNARVLSVQDYTVSGVDAGSLGLSGQFGSLDSGIFTAMGPVRLKALFGGDVSQLQAKFVNRGLFEKALAYFAKQQKKTVESLRAEWAAMSTQILPLLLGGDPASLSLAQSLQTFINDPKSLTISLKARGASVPIAQLQAIRDPQTFLALVEVSAKANE